MTRLVLSVVMLTLVYALALGSLDPWDLAIGAGIAVGLLILFRPVTVGHHATQLPGLPGRLLAFFPFVVWVALDIVVSAWRVGLVIVGIRTLHHAEVVAVPVSTRFAPTGAASTLPSACVSVAGIVTVGVSNSVGVSG